MSRPFTVGDRVLLIDSKKRWYLVTLKVGGEFHSHAGFVAHDDLIGHGEGRIVTSTKGSKYEAFRPTLADFILKMPRGAQVIYPKDLGTRRARPAASPNEPDDDDLDDEGDGRRRQDTPGDPGAATGDPGSTLEEPAAP